ncbi:hypothetical protein BKE38_27570 [Pseudoroseomonas deserti]|uniref:ABC transporter substrate-binding protein n=1 Tax=Teichococcus deserti TaxID=1817963 RepID=A0A1V2GU24_9PROT|nr:hypothetical protein BKE38_27570 [Pseudoroseomonas deserti]
MSGRGARAVESFPGRVVTLVVSGPAGGTTDYTARPISQPLSDRLGVPVVVENRAGGNGMLALQAVIRAKPDGHTLLIGCSGTITGKPAVEGFGDVDPRRDLAADCREILADISLQRRALEAGALVSFEDPPGLERRVAGELAMWTKLVKETGIRPDEPAGRPGLSPAPPARPRRAPPGPRAARRAG